jgi:conjugative relaxase-like TrwC/TraI family protein
VLSVKRIRAGRGAVDYYVGRVRTGLGEYYLAGGDTDQARLAVPLSSWWGGSSGELGLGGEVARDAFAPLYAKGVQPDGSRLGRAFRLPEQVQDAKDEALARAAAITDPDERARAEFDVRRRSWQPSVAGWDCTFSPVKSVSLLWAAGDEQIREQVWAAHMAAVDAGLEYLQEHGSYVRAGHAGVRVLDTDGFVAARFNEWTSRSGDMQLHTHCVVLNRARTVEDGRWRALDGRALLAARTGAGAIYARSVEAELTRRLGVAWRDRPDGLRELAGVDDELIETFSTRRRAITAVVERMAAVWERRHGHAPPAAVLSSMAQQATLATRPGKQDLAAGVALERWEATARARGRSLRQLPSQVIGRVIGRATPESPGAGDGAAVDARAVLDRLGDSGRATFTRHDTLRAALDCVRPGASGRDALRATAEALADRALADLDAVRVSVDDPAGDQGPDHRRADGTSVYDPPHRHRWALRRTIDQEQWLLDVAPEPAGHTVTPRVVDEAAERHALGDDQAAAVRRLLGEDRRIGLLVGPAGAGKTRTLRAVADAWHHHGGGTVVGLTVSQAAAQVLAAEAGIESENTAKWLWETAAGRWQLPQGSLLVIDEASMLPTDQLVTLVEQARRTGSRVLLIGDPAQLSAVHIGGTFDLLTERHGAATLTEIRRFTHQWERDASVQLRNRDINGIATYVRHGRVHGGPTAQVEQDLFAAWERDTLTPDNEGQTPTVLMVVATNDQAAVLAERARGMLLNAGSVHSGPTVQLRDNVASVGDRIVTRRNDRRLTTDSHGWVINGDVWTIEQLHIGGSATVRRRSDQSRVRLPARYLRDHTHLGYATTAHRAQGMTVDIAHTAVTPDMNHQLLYVGATRGRHANHLWVATDTERDTIRTGDDLPDPETVLAGVLARRDPTRQSAHAVHDDSNTEMNAPVRLHLIDQDASQRDTDTWLRQRMLNHGMAEATTDPEWPELVATIRRATAAGHSPNHLLARALTSRPLDDALSAAAVLQWRITQLTAVATGRRMPRRKPPSANGISTTPEPRTHRSPSTPTRR